MQTFTNALLLIFLLSCASAAHFEACDANSSGTFLPFAHSCRGYIYCNGSESFQDDCPQDAFFDAEAQECVFSEGFQCESSSESSDAVMASAATTSAVKSSAPFVVAVRPKCRRDVEEYFAHALRCEYYYKCTRGYLAILRCNFNYGWDHLQQFCMPMQQANCFRSKT